MAATRPDALACDDRFPAGAAAPAADNSSRTDPAVPPAGDGDDDGGGDVPPSEPAKTLSRSAAKTSAPDGVRRLSASKIHELTTAPDSLPVATLSQRPSPLVPATASFADHAAQLQSDGTNPRVLHHARPNTFSRTLSTPPTNRRKSHSQSHAQPLPARRNSFHPAPRPAPLDLDGRNTLPLRTPMNQHVRTPANPTFARHGDPVDAMLPEPIAPSVPLPPMSVPTLLQLELAGERPSPLYIYQSSAGHIPYESSAVKFERLKNFLVLPVYLERTMNFGALACLDAWLWTFTILPMRFCIVAGLLLRWWAYVIGKESRWLVGFVWSGLGRMWQRGRRGRTTMGRAQAEAVAPARRPEKPPRLASAAPGVAFASKKPQPQPQPKPAAETTRHRRTKSTPSTLTSCHKADLIQMAVIIFSSLALLELDASRMYHFIRAQSQVKLYVIFNLLEVGDRLLSAVGQDITECLFSAETLSRTSAGRPKLALPFAMFLLTLAYNVFHAAVLFYQVITLNVAVNSYSHALLSLLMSNQFVEVKSAVFKRFEKENSFQLTCADIVERFQLWIMLLIIGLRNVVEVGGLSVPGAGVESSPAEASSTMPIHTASILPASFTILPSWLRSGEVLSPFLIVIGSEMVVDWIKHAFINKFNNVKPNFYSRTLDILCQDYYTNAFVTPSLTRRLGLPLLPLSCLFIRASVQTYHMFVATHVPTPLPPATQTALSVDSAAASLPSPALSAALDRIDHLLRSALGRAVYGQPGSSFYAFNATAGFAPPRRLCGWTSDDVVAALTMVVVFLLIFLVLLVVKLALGMALLRYARDRYARMRAREHAVAAGQAEREVYDAAGRRVGGYGQVEVGEERRRWIYADDAEGLRKLKEKESGAEARRRAGREVDLAGVRRYDMVAKRIW